MSQLPLSPAATMVLLSAGLLVSALAVVASTHHVREGYARLQDLELRRWELQEQYTRLLLEVRGTILLRRSPQVAAPCRTLCRVASGRQSNMCP